VLAYSDGKGGTVRHYNPPAVLEAALTDLQDVPVTFNHPAKMVTTQTYRDVAAGHVVGAAAFTAGHIHATLAIQDAQLLQAIEAHVAREVSMGYSVEYDDTPGVTEAGEVYDVIRTKISWNHIAIVPEGRAGRSVRCMLDSQDIPTDEAEVLYKIDGAEVAQDNTQAAIDAVCGARDAAVAQVAALTDALAVATSDAALDAAVQKRIDADAAAVAAAAAVVAATARRAAVQLSFPQIALDGRSQDYIDALFDARPVIDEALAGLVAPPVVVVVPPVARVSARDRMRAAQAAQLGAKSDE